MSLALVVLGAVLTIVLIAATLVLDMAIFVALPGYDFGIYSGLAQPHLLKKKRVQQPALTEWLADKIDLVAAVTPREVR